MRPAKMTKYVLMEKKRRPRTKTKHYNIKDTVERRENQQGHWEGIASDIGGKPKENNIFKANWRKYTKKEFEIKEKRIGIWI